jgi:hypothetical protein
MSETGFNVAETYLLQRWSEARELEETLASARRRYEAILDRVAEALRARYPALTWHGHYVSQLVNDELLFSNGTWPKHADWPVGFYATHVGLDALLQPDPSPPTMYLWLKPLRKLGLNHKKVSGRVIDAAKTLLPADELARVIWESDEDHPLEYALPSAHELRRFLVAGRSSEFAELLASELDPLLRLAAPLHEALASSTAKSA